MIFSKLVAYLCLILAFVGLPACGKNNRQKEATNRDKIVAHVNYDKIYLSKLSKEIKQFEANYGIIHAEKKERYQKISKYILEELIQKKLYLQEAERLKIKALDDEIENYVKNIISDYSQESFKRMLESRNIDYDEWNFRIRENLLFQKLIDQEVKSKIETKDSEIKSYYKAHSKDYMLPERVQALQIVVNNELEAETIYNRLLEGDDFSKLAQSKSVSPEGIHGGDLGVFSRDQMPKEFDDAVFNLKVGQFSKVVQSPYGYHIFKVVRKKRAKNMNLKDSRGKIKKKLLKEKEKKEFLIWSKKLKEKSIVIIKEDVLSNIWQKT